jgi:hypothetical protein
MVEGGMMSTRYDFQITDNGDVIVLLPGGALCDFSQHGLSDERIAQAAFRQLIADIAERDARIAELSKLVMRAGSDVMEQMARAERAEAELARLRAQEPVAWMWNDELGCHHASAGSKKPIWLESSASAEYIRQANLRPLYAEPMPAKESK